MSRDPSVAVRVGRWVAAARGFARLRTLRLARFGDNMRDVAVTEGDKVEAELRFGVSVNTYGVNDLVAVVDAVDDKTIDDLVAEYADRYEIVPAAPGRRRPGTTRCATPRVSKPGCANSSLTAGSARSPPTSRTSAAYGNCRDSPCSA